MHIAELWPRPSFEGMPERRAAAYAHVEGEKGVLGNGLMEVEIDYGRHGSEVGIIHNKLTGEEVTVRFEPFEAWFDSGRADATQRVIGAFEARGSADVASLVAHASYGWFEVAITYSLHRGHHFFRKVLSLHSFKKKALLHKLSLYRHILPTSSHLLLHDAGMYYPVAFLRMDQGGLFYCADFAGYFVSWNEENVFTFDYYPGETLEPGRSYQSMAVNLGVYQLGGRVRVNPYHERGAPLDIGERDWFREYLRLGCHVTALPYAEVKGPEPGIEGASEVETIEQCRQLGVNHVLLPRMLANVDSYPHAARVRKALAESSVHSVMFLSRDATPNLRWVALDAEGHAAGPDMGECFACEEFRDALVDRSVDAMDKHGFSDVEVRGAPLVACHSLGHGHAPGLESLQRAFQGLVEVTGALRENSGHVRCGGPYGSYGTGLSWLFDRVPFLVEDYPLPLPDIHVGRLFADMSRLYFRRSHDFLLPKSRLSNSVGLVAETCPQAPFPGSETYPWYLYHDKVGWRYSLISAIATGLRHQFHAVAQGLSEEDCAFARKWLAWEEEHCQELMDVEEILDEPGLNSVDGYAYVNGKGATVFLFNTSCDTKDVRLRLRLAHDCDYVVREIYPREMNYLGPREGLFRKDSEVPIAMAPREARVIEAVRRSPASTKRKRPEVFGAVVAKDSDQAVAVTGKPGTSCRVGVRAGARWREEDIQFPGKAFPKHIADWRVEERPLDAGMATMSRGEFTGEKWSPRTSPGRNVWLRSDVMVSAEYEEHINTMPFRMVRPAWAMPDRLFFMIRFEPPGAFDPIRTSSQTPGVPEAYLTRLPMKCGIDLTTLNLGLRAWLNGQECEVYPALAPWNGFLPNAHPVVAYFFEAGSKLRFGTMNRVVIFASHFESPAFRGICVEHAPTLRTEKEIALA